MPTSHRPTRRGIDVPGGKPGARSARRAPASQDLHAHGRHRGSRVVSPCLAGRPAGRGAGWVAPALARTEPAAPALGRENGQHSSVRVPTPCRGGARRSESPRAINLTKRGALGNREDVVK
jgi:hypothetical protein